MTTRMQCPECDCDILTLEGAEPSCTTCGWAPGHPVIGDGPDREYTPATGHSKDSDCTVGADECCTVCNVYHGDPCPLCDGAGFHVGDCDGTYAATLDADIGEGETVRK